MAYRVLDPVDRVRDVAQLGGDGPELAAQCDDLVVHHLDPGT
ncbi:hypothetical protein ABT009_28655 [Streptomyces sp. NPDC002896]